MTVLPFEHWISKRKSQQMFASAHEHISDRRKKTPGPSQQQGLEQVELATIRKMESLSVRCIFRVLFPRQSKRWDL